MPSIFAKGETKEAIDILLGEDYDQQKKDVSSEIKGIFEIAKRNYQSIERNYQRVAKLFYPNSNQFSTSKGGDSSKDVSREIYDNTATLSASGFTNFLKNTIAPAGSDFFEFKNIDKVDAKVSQDITKTVFDNIKSSNFDRVCKTFFDNIGVGTGVMKVSAKDYGRGSALTFMAYSINGLRLSTDVYGEPNRVFYEHEGMSATNIKEGWSNVNISEEEEKKRKNDTLIEFSIFLYTEAKKNGNRVPVYLYGLCDSDFRHFYKLERLYHPRMFVTRFDVRGTNPYGYSPPHEIISSVEELNELRKIFREGCEYSYKPPTFIRTYDDSLDSNQIEIQAGKAIVLPSSVEDIKMFNVTFNPSELRAEMMALQATVREYLMADSIGGTEKARYVTAEAIAIIQRQLLNRFSGVWGSMQNEFLPNLALCCLHELNSVNKLSIADGDIDIFELKPKNPVALNSDMKEIDKLMSDFQYTASIVGAEVALEKFDIPNLVLKISEIIGTDTDMLKRNKKELEGRVMEVRQAMLGMGGATKNVNTATSF